MESNKGKHYFWIAAIFLAFILLFFYWDSFFSRPLEDYLPFLSGQNRESVAPVASGSPLPKSEDERIHQQILRDMAERWDKIMKSQASYKEGGTPIRAWFADNSHVYVEHGAASSEFQVLFKVDKKDGEMQYNTIGFFEPGESDWELIEGEDPFFGESRILYEKNEKGEWIRRN